MSDKDEEVLEASLDNSHPLNVQVAYLAQPVKEEPQLVAPRARDSGSTSEAQSSPSAGATILLKIAKYYWNVIVSIESLLNKDPSLSVVTVVGGKLATLKFGYLFTCSIS